MHETIKSHALTNIGGSRQAHNTVQSRKIIKGIDPLNIDQVLLDRNNTNTSSIIVQQTVDNQLPQLIICGNQQDANNSSQQQFKRMKSIQQRSSIKTLQNQTSQNAGQTQLIVKDVSSNNANENLVTSNAMQSRTPYVYCRLVSDCIIIYTII